MRRLLVGLAVAALGTGCAHGRTWKGVGVLERPVLTLYPRIAITARPPIMARAMLLVEVDTDCPKLTWDWGDGCVSVEESDCEPHGELARRLFTRLHPYQARGEFLVRVTVEYGGKSATESGVLTFW